MVAYTLAVTSLVSLCCSVAFSQEKQEKSREKTEDRQYDGEFKMKGTNGETAKVSFLEESPERLCGRIELKGLRPSRVYILTINGKPGKPGNDILKEKCKTFNDDEGYCDMTKITTDAKGEYEGTFKSRKLPPSEYDVKFLVKDRDASYKVILNEDDMLFTINEPEKKEAEKK